jgi:hypothetical protein
VKISGNFAGISYNELFDLLHFFKESGFLFVTTRCVDDDDVETFFFECVDSFFGDFDGIGISFANSISEFKIKRFRNHIPSVKRDFNFGSVLF